MRTTFHFLSLGLQLSYFIHNVNAAFSLSSLSSNPSVSFFPWNSRNMGLRQQRLSTGGISYSRSRHNRIRLWPTQVKKGEAEEDISVDESSEVCIDPFSACWNATTFNINPHEDDTINKILQGLCSPAPQSFFVLNRAVQRYYTAHRDDNSGNNEGLHDILASLSYLIKPGFQLVFLSNPTNFSLLNDRKKDLLWRVINEKDIPGNEWNIVSSSFRCNASSLSTKSTLEMAHEALEYVVSHSDSSSEQQNPQDIDFQQQKIAFKVSQVVEAATEKLKWTLGTDIRGRSSADAAFCFALSGANTQFNHGHKKQDEDIFRTLAMVAGHELKRTGARPSFRNQYILQIVEKIAASGLKGEEVETLYRTAAKCLLEKGESSTVVEPLLTREYNLLSPRPLLWLWRFSSRQRKPTTRKQTRPKDYALPSSTELPKLIDNYTTDNSPISDWWQAFEDPTRPLVVDVGCGMGVSLIGMSQINNQTILPPSCASTLTTESWDKCNYVGCDLSNLGIGYANGVATRWNVKKQVQFVRMSAQNLLDEILNVYPGNSVPLIMIQFPTPFQMPDKISPGNTQLPTDASSGFMASAALLQTAARILKLKINASGGNGGRILLQSNCEDVAVIMRQMAMDYGFQSIDVPTPVTERIECQESDGSDIRIPLRMQEWIRQGGDRAIGSAWSRESLLPPNCETETAVACKMQGNPIHRCLLEINY